MINLMDLARVCVHIVRGVEHDGTVVPRLLPQLVTHVEVFVGPVVALVVFKLETQPLALSIR